MPKLNVDTSLIETLAELLQRTGLTEIEISEGDARIRVVREQPSAVTHVAHGPRQAPVAPPMPAAAEPAPRDMVESHPGAVRAPMVGTVYLTAEPGAPSFVSLGDEIREGQTLLIIEAMKVMNPIRAPRGGRLIQLLVNSGDPVEYGELLMIIE
ncbi:MAG: acetyl-CoA carboxylase biotin carboxyl carrier protein [Geminicoccaceae bacterium]